MAEETQYTASTGMAVLNASNSDLDGTGTLNTNIWSVIAASNSQNGMLIRTVTVKATTDTTQSIIRLFINDGGGSGSSHTKLISEIEVPAVTKSSTDPAFEITIPVDYALQPDYELWATVEFSSGSPSFNVIAEGLDWDYYASSVRPESSNYVANTGFATVDTAETSLTSPTNIESVLTADDNGTIIQSLTIKALETVTAGMIRLWLYDGSNTRLFREIPVEATTQTSTANAFQANINFGGQGFALKDTWVLKATTQNSEEFNVIAEGLDWTYPA